jgi:hypothetical protein
MDQREMEKFVWQALAENVRGRVYEGAETRIMGVGTRWHGPYNLDTWLTEAEVRRLKRAMRRVREQVRRRGD